MRVLTVVSALTGMVASGCYSPALDDCQFTCGADQQPCPSGSTCMGGVCRTESTGTCTGSGSGSDSGVDASGDGNTEVCPQAPPSPSGCSQRFSLGGSGCGVMCATTSMSRADAKTACNGGWRLAVLDSAAQLNLAPITSGTYWVGAVRQMSGLWQWETTGSPVVANECWSSGAPPVAGDKCAVVDGAVRRMNNSVACTGLRPFICTYP